MGNETENTSLNYTPLDTSTFSAKTPINTHIKQKQFLFIVAGGIIILFFLFLLIIVSVANRGKSNTAPNTAPTPIIPVTSTPKTTPQPGAYQSWQNYDLNGLANFKYPTTWRFISGLSSNYIDTANTNKKIFSKNCNGPVLQNSSHPTSLILFDIQTVATDSASCVSKANVSDFYVRQMTAFNPPQTINVIKWKANDYYENGSIKRSTWQGDLLEQQVFQNNVISITAYLVHQDNQDSTAELTFDNLLASFKMKNATTNSTEPQSITLEKSILEIPAGWWSDSFQDDNGNKLYLINPTTITGTAKPAFIFKYMGGKTQDQVKNILTKQLSLTDITQKDIDYGYNGGIEINGTATGGDLDHKPIRIAIISVPAGTYYIENDIIQSDTTDYVKSFVSSLRITN